MLQQDHSESAGPPRWVSQASLDNAHVGLASDGVYDADLITLDLNHAPRLNDDRGVGFDPHLGWVTSRENIHEHRGLFEQVVPIALVAFVGWAAGGAALAANWGTVGAAAAAGAASSFAGGVINGNLSLKGVLIGAVSGALTAGLTPELTGVLQQTGMGAAAGVAARMTVQGGIQALLGGKFKDGAIAGFASSLAELTSANIKTSIQQALASGTMSASEALAARTFNTMLGSAIRAAGSPGDPAHAFAQEWLGAVMQDNLPPVQAPAPAPATGVEAFPVPDPGLAEITPLPPTAPDLSLITPRPGESDSEFTVRMMREIYGQNVDLNPAGEHNQYQIYRDENGQMVVTDGTGMTRPIDPAIKAAFEARLAGRMQQLNAMAAVQRSQAFSEWAAANNRPVALPPEPGVLDQRIPVVADVRDFLLAKIDQAVANANGSGQTALEGLRMAVEALTPETFGDAALNELGAGVLKAGVARSHQDAAGASVGLAELLPRTKPLKRDPLFGEERLHELLEIFNQVAAKTEKALGVPAVNKLFEPTFLWNCAWHQLDLLLLRYSCGNTVSDLKQHLLRLLELWERSEQLAATVWTEDDRAARGRWEGNISFYNRCFWLVGLAFALELEETHWQRVLMLIGNEGQDALLDRAISKRQPGRVIGSKLCHPKPYARLLAVLNAPAAQQPSLLRDFVDHWYAELDRAPKKGLSKLTNLEDRPYWYGNHEGISSYFGYWCVEAVAVVKAFGVDDSLCVGHANYPGDLLRLHGPTTHTTAPVTARVAAKTSLLQKLRNAF